MPQGSGSRETLRELMAIGDRMNRMLDERLGFGSVGIGDPFNEVWRPPVDLVETPDAFVFRVELAGVARDDIDIEVDQRTLRLRGIKRFTREVDQQRFHRMECGYGRFERRFTLPVDVDTDRVAAKLEEGVLTVRVPKVQSQVVRKVEIEP